MGTQPADVLPGAECDYISLVIFLLAAAAVVYFPICSHPRVMLFGFVVTKLLTTNFTSMVSLTQVSV